MRESIELNIQTKPRHPQIKKESGITKSMLLNAMENGIKDLKNGYIAVVFGGVPEEDNIVTLKLEDFARSMEFIEHEYNEDLTQRTCPRVKIVKYEMVGTLKNVPSSDI